MIKVHGIMQQGFFLKERQWRDEGQRREGPSPGDTVTISEEGKKRRVMGHVMANISGQGVKKTT